MLFPYLAYILGFVKPRFSQLFNQPLGHVALKWSVDFTLTIHYPVFFG
jgi:hypothetical protein